MADPEFVTKEDLIEALEAVLSQLVYHDGEAISYLLWRLRGPYAASAAHVEQEKT